MLLKIWFIFKLSGKFKVQTLEVKKKIGSLKFDRFRKNKFFSVTKSQCACSPSQESDLLETYFWAGVDFMKQFTPYTWKLLSAPIFFTLI
jgi:hypothetical protein